jgi:hypothetical protein
MKLHEILENVDMLVYNSISAKKKVEWLNQVQRQSYRDFGFPDVSYAFISEPGINFYQLPDNCSRERITSVIVDENEYTYHSVDDDVNSNAWSIVEERLWIYPTPTGSVTMFLNYRPRPDDMQVNMMDVEPKFPVDFQEILVYGIAARVARASQDAAKAAEMEMQYEILHDKAKKALRPARQKTVKQTRNWR